MSFFSRPVEPESDIDLYNRLKKLSKEDIKDELDMIFKTRGAETLNKIFINALLDIEKENSDINLTIQFIESYSGRLLNKETNRKAMVEVLKTWEGRLIAIGSFGLFLLEMIRYIDDRWIKIK